MGVKIKRLFFGKEYRDNLATALNQVSNEVKRSKNDYIKLKWEDQTFNEGQKVFKTDISKKMQAIRQKYLDNGS